MTPFRIHILAIDTGNEAHAIRSVAEQFGFQVTVTCVGQSRHFFDGLLNNSAELVLISGHGEGGKILLPEFVHPDFPHLPTMVSAEYLQDLANQHNRPLKDKFVLSTACESDTSQLAESLFALGATHFLAPNVEVESNDTLMFVVEFLFKLQKELNPKNEKAKRDKPFKSNADRDAYGFLPGQIDRWAEFSLITVN